MGNLRECFPKYAIYIYIYYNLKNIYIYIYYIKLQPQKNMLGSVQYGLVETLYEKQITRHGLASRTSTNAIRYVTVAMLTSQPT